MTLSFFVHGTPKAQGSTQARVNKKTGKAYTQGVSSQLAAWRNLIVDRALDAIAVSGWEMAEGPVRVTYEFGFRRPKSHSRKRRESDGGWHYSRPDADKLERAVNDALTVARVWKDDAQVACCLRHKFYVADDRSEGVWVRVEG